MCGISCIKPCRGIIEERVCSKFQQGSIKSKKWKVVKFPGGVFKKNSCEISIWAFLAINLEISKRGAGALCMSNNFAENLEVKACFSKNFLEW